MPSSVFTPRQVAQALGVSESSVKRWVDNGKLGAAKTVGGHRKVSLESLIRFIRETGQPLADPELVGMAANTTKATVEGSREELYELLVQGHEADCRELVLGLYLRGESIADLGDGLIGPVFNRIGDDWAEGVVSVHQERRACEVIMATLHEVRRTLEAPAESAPLAVAATPSNDFALVATRLVEMTLITHGWRVEVAGSGLPLEEIREFVLRAEPKMLAISATHLRDASEFLEEFNAKLARPLATEFAARAGVERPRLVLGGHALCSADTEKVECELCASRLADLVSYQATLQQDA